jgi:methanogenic corrinoid protein MtbC1
MASVFGVQQTVPAQRWRHGRDSDSPSKVAPESDRQSSRLAALVEQEIIPRLLVLHCGSMAATPSLPASAILPEEAAAFATLPLTLEADALLDQVQNFLDRGVSVGSILVDLLAPSARELGRLWEEDICSFVDVTMGLWRLQEVMREVAWRVPALADPRDCHPSALFAGMPGEQHSFGTLMIHELFERDGWRSEALIEVTRHDLLAAIEARHIDLVGLTISCDCHSGDIRKLIKAIRSVSHNPQVRIMIGGRVVNANPALVSECGADGTAPDAQSAVAFANRLVRGTQRLAAIAS